MTQIQHLIERNFSLLLLIGAIAGFFVPSFGEYADEIVILLVASQIFLSCADIKPVDFLKIDIFQVGVFTLLRFAILPLVLFYTFRDIFPEYAIGILLLSLMPTAMAMASICSISNAKVALGLSITIVTSILTPIFIPGIFSFLGHYVEVEVVKLFFALMIIVVLPIGLYFLSAYKFPSAISVVKKYNKAVAVINMAVVLMVIIASQKQTLLADPAMIFHGLLVMSGLFAILYIFGIVYSLFVGRASRTTYILASGAMNNALAVGLAFAYFDSTTSLFIVLSEIVWCFYIAGAQYFFSHKKLT